mmetsp:Transcript_42897/g.103778  ORF Transcript_42897/g.103778 Transcript_42897/m.103778 type:complete len:114 (-) Transcript_42897:584-925(-)
MSETSPINGKASDLREAHNTPNILLAVTGSVAAIKCPEIAVRLVRECGANVKVLLSQGGKNFWDKSRGYNQQYWDFLLDELKNQTISIIRKWQVRGVVGAFVSVMSMEKDLSL